MVENYHIKTYLFTFHKLIKVDTFFIALKIFIIFVQEQCYNINAIVQCLKQNIN